MKITKNQLKRIIKEELVHFMDEKMEGAEELMEAAISPQQAMATWDERRAARREKLAARKAAKAQAQPAAAPAQADPGTGSTMGSAQGDPRKLKKQMDGIAATASSVVTRVLAAGDKHPKHDQTMRKTILRSLQAWPNIRKTDTWPEEFKNYADAHDHADQSILTYQRATELSDEQVKQALKSLEIGDMFKRRFSQ